MNPEKLQDAIGMIGDDLILEAKNYKRKNNNKIIKIWISAVAAVLVIAFLNSNVLNSFYFRVSAISETKYPECVQYPDENLSEDEYEEAYALWEQDQQQRKSSFDGDFENLEYFFTESVKEFVSASDENAVISPLSMYISLGIIAEITDGNSRQQILDLLNLDTIEALREQMCSIFEYHYCNDGKVTSVISNSLWLNSDLQYNQSALDKLAEIYYASSYRGDMGSDAYNRKLRDWINEQTNDFMKDKNGNIQMTEDTVLNIANTISFGAEWLDMFLPEDGYSGAFYMEDSIKHTSYCGQSIYRDYYTTDDFSAVKQEMTGGYGMWLIRPDNDTDAQALISDDSTMEFIMSNGENAEQQEMLVNLSLPVFDAYSEIELSDGYKNMGLTDIFDSELSDFSTVISNGDVELSSIQHNVRVKIDDNAETADDYTVTTDNSGMPESADSVDLLLNKPFIFAITSDVGIPLMVGIVNQPL